MQADNPLHIAVHVCPLGQRAVKPLHENFSHSIAQMFSSRLRAWQLDSPAHFKLQEDDESHDKVIVDLEGDICWPSVVDIIVVPDPVIPDVVIVIPEGDICWPPVVDIIIPDPEPKKLLPKLILPVP